MSSKGLSYDVVMNMVEGLENQGYIVYTDNFYSSPTLFTDLVNKGFGAVGTIDPTRRGVQLLLDCRRRRCYARPTRGGMGFGLEMSQLFSAYGEILRLCVWLRLT